jgi:cell division protein FtsB
LNGQDTGSTQSPLAAKIDRAKKPLPVGFGDQFSEFIRRNMNWFLIAALGLLFIQDIFGTHGVLAMHRSSQEAAAAQKQIDQLNEENKKLQDRVQQLKSDPATIERIAREDMGLARPGEYIFKIPAKPGESTAPGPRVPDPSPTR